LKVAQGLPVGGTFPDGDMTEGNTLKFLCHLSLLAAAFATPAHADEVSRLARCVRQEATYPVTDPVRRIAADRITVGTGHNGPEIPAAENHEFRNGGAKVTMVIIAVHGEKRNADCYQDYSDRLRAKAASAFGLDPASIGVVAPQFLVGADVAKIDAEPDGARIAFWQDTPGLDQSDLPNKKGTDAWESGALSGNAGVSGDIDISSYAAIDAVLRTLADRQHFPALRRVVIVGFSAGAQLVQRYAYVARGTQALAPLGIVTRFVVASPDSYAWPTRLRPDGEGGYAIPTSAPQCDAAALLGYDNWKYGLEGRLPPSFDGLDPALLARLYPSIPVHFLVGGDDKAAIDQSCAAVLQGADRLTRAQNFVGFTQSQHPQRPQTQPSQTQPPQTLAIVPGARHNPLAVLVSPEGLDAVFRPDGP
jgi:pimeloyl-ACP methyl ester carboxylesterase